MILVFGYWMALVLKSVRFVLLFFKLVWSTPLPLGPLGPSIFWDGVSNPTPCSSQISDTSPPKNRVPGAPEDLGVPNWKCGDSYLET